MKHLTLAWQSADRRAAQGARQGRLASVLPESGLRIIPRDRRKSPGRTTRLLAVLDAAPAEGEEKELAPAGADRTVLARPVVSAGSIAAELKISQRAALDLVAELGIPKVTGRGRYRAWGTM